MSCNKRDLKQLIEMLVCEKIRDKGLDNFDIEEFKRLTSRNDALYYADTRLTIIGRGSSRSVYAYSSKYVLKIAHNFKGFAQNEGPFFNLMATTTCTIRC